MAEAMRFQWGPRLAQITNGLRVSGEADFYFTPLKTETPSIPNCINETAKIGGSKTLRYKDALGQKFQCDSRYKIATEARRTDLAHIWKCHPGAVDGPWIRYSGVPMGHSHLESVKMTIANSI